MAKILDKELIFETTLLVSYHLEKDYHITIANVESKVLDFIIID